MKNLNIYCLLALVGLIAGTSCGKTNNPEPPTDCIEGVVIAENYRTNTTPNTLGACETVVQIKNRNIGAKFMNQYDNCVIIRNLDANLAKLNQKVYFRTFIEDIQCGPWLTDCTPVESCIIAINLSTQCNPK